MKVIVDVDDFGNLVDKDSNIFGQRDSYNLEDYDESTLGTVLSTPNNYFIVDLLVNGVSVDDIIKLNEAGLLG